MSSAMKEGFLTKQGGRVKNWKRRLFKLEGSELAYYSGAKQKGAINLKNVTRVEANPVFKKKHCFDVEVVGKEKRVFHILGDTPEDVAAWVEAISAALKTIGTETAATSNTSSTTTVISTSSTTSKTSFSSKDVKVEYETFDDGIYAVHRAIVDKLTFSLIFVSGQLSSLTDSTISFLHSSLDIKNNEHISKYVTGAYSIDKTQDTDYANTSSSTTTNNNSSSNNNDDDDAVNSSENTGASNQKLCFLTDHVLNENIFHLLQTSGKMTVNDVKIYAAEIVDALSYIFEKNACLSLILPYNLLLDDKGHIKLLAIDLINLDNDERVLDKHMRLLAEYTAPEVMDTFRFTQKANVWNLGVLMYEMIELLPPFYADTSEATFRAVREGELTFPEGNEQFTPEIIDLLRKILDRDTEKRLTLQQIRDHPFFEGVSWEDVKEGRIKAPIPLRQDDTAYEFDPMRIIWKVV